VAERSAYGFGREAEQIVEHEDLRVGTGAAADPDRRNRNAFGDFGRDLGVDHFEHDGERAGSRDRIGVGAELRALCAATEAAIERGGLRTDADVRDDGDTGPHDRRDALGTLDAALELHRHRAGANQAAGAVHGLDVRGFVRHERQIDADVRARRAAHDRRTVAFHIFERDRRGGRVAQHDVPERIADQDHVDPGSLSRPAERRIVGRDRRKFTALTIAHGGRAQTRGHVAAKVALS